MSQVSLVPVMAWILALACWGIAMWRGKTWRGTPQVSSDLAIDRALRYVFLFPLGLVSLWAFAGHVFFPERAAAAIGWQPSPFQFEVGVANLGIGLASLYAAFARLQARLAVAIAASCFLMGAGIGHVHSILTIGNLAPGNAGPILISDFLAPVVALALIAAAAWRLTAWRPTSWRPAAWSPMRLWPRPKSPDSQALEAEFAEARRAMRSYRQALDSFGRD